MSGERLKELNAKAAALVQARSAYDDMFRTLGRHFKQERSRFEKGNAHRSSHGTNKTMVNGRPRYSHRTLQSGMHVGMTSPARPWFKLMTSDPDMREIGAVKEHYASAQREMYRIAARSGSYEMLHSMWGDAGLYGFDAGLLEDDPVAGLHGQALVPGEAYLGVNGRAMVDTLYRTSDFTVQQVVGKFVYMNDPRGDADWGKVTTTVKKLWDDGNITALVPVRQIICPRTERDSRMPDAANKPTASVYWEEGESNKLLGDLGYDVSPIVASRWEGHGTNIYGTSPCMDALGDAQTLQLKARDKAEAIRRMNRPPMNAPVEMRNNPFSLMPEAVNFMADPSKGLVPAYQVTPPLQQLIEDERNSEEAVNEGTYANLFLMMATLNDRTRTAREIDERHEEKLVGLGPVLERQQREKLGPFIARLYAKAVESGNVKPLPPEYDGIDTTVDYISTLARAQRAVATGGIERLYAFAGSLSAVDGSIMDNLDNDTAIRGYAENLGVDGNIVRVGSEVTELREARRKSVEQQQSMEAAGQAADIATKGAQAAKVLSETDSPRSGSSGGLLADLGITR